MKELVDRLWKQHDAFKWLYDRGFTAEDIWEFELGWDPAKRAIHIPYFVGAVEQEWYRLRLLYPSGPKYLSAKGHGNHLYNVDATQGSHVYLTEGEFDCMILRKLGLDAVGVPGASSFRKEWRFLFQDCDTVTVCMDADTAGDNASGRIRAWLGDVCDDVRKLELPSGLDVNDAYLDGSLEGVLLAAA